MQQIRVITSLSSYSNHGITELVENLLTLGLCRFNHDCPLDHQWKVDGRRVVSIVNQTFCHVQRVAVAFKIFI